MSKRPPPSTAVEWEKNGGRYHKSIGWFGIAVMNAGVQVTMALPSKISSS